MKDKTIGLFTIVLFCAVAESRQAYPLLFLGS